MLSGFGDLMKKPGDKGGACSGGGAGSGSSSSSNSSSSSIDSDKEMHDNSSAARMPTSAASTVGAGTQQPLQPPPQQLPLQQPPPPEQPRQPLSATTLRVQVPLQSQVQMQMQQMQMKVSPMDAGGRPSAGSEAGSKVGTGLRMGMGGVAMQSNDSASASAKGLLSSAIGLTHAKPVEPRSPQVDKTKERLDTDSPVPKKRRHGSMHVS
jgi:hypothetical protein